MCCFAVHCFAVHCFALHVVAFAVLFGFCFVSFFCFVRLLPLRSSPTYDNPSDPLGLSTLGTASRNFQSRCGRRVVLVENVLSLPEGPLHFLIQDFFIQRLARAVLGVYPEASDAPNLFAFLVLISHLVGGFSSDPPDWYSSWGPAFLVFICIVYGLTTLFFALLSFSSVRCLRYSSVLSRHAATSTSATSALASTLIFFFLKNALNCSPR